MYFPFIFTLFMFVLFCNLLGMIPYTFTVTSQIIVTFALAALVFIGVTLIGIFKHGFKFLTFFVPSGVPVVLLVILVPIEIISYFVRPISLSVRLFANMLAGAYAAESVWRICCQPRNLSRVAALRVYRCSDRLGISGRFLAGLCVRHPVMPLS